MTLRTAPFSTVPMTLKFSPGPLRRLSRLDFTFLSASTKPPKTQTAADGGSEILYHLSGSFGFCFVVISSRTVTLSPFFKCETTSLLIRAWPRTLTFFWETTAGSGLGSLTVSPDFFAAVFEAESLVVAPFEAAGFFLAFDFGGVGGGASAGMTGGSAASVGATMPAASSTARNVRSILFISGQVEILSRVLSTSAICRAAARQV